MRYTKTDKKILIESILSCNSLNFTNMYSVIKFQSIGSKFSLMNSLNKLENLNKQLLQM